MYRHVITVNVVMCSLGIMLVSLVGAARVMGWLLCMLSRVVALIIVLLMMLSLPIIASPAITRVVV